MEPRHYAPAVFVYLANGSRAAGHVTDAVRFEGISLVCLRLFAHLPARGIAGAFEMLGGQDGPVGLRARETRAMLRQWYDEPGSDECLPAVSTMFSLTARAFVRVLREKDLTHTQRVDVAQVMDDLLADATTLAMGQDFGPREGAVISSRDLPSLAALPVPLSPAL